MMCRLRCCGRGLSVIVLSLVCLFRVMVLIGVFLRIFVIGIGLLSMRR